MVKRKINVGVAVIMFSRSPAGIAPLPSIIAALPALRRLRAQASGISVS